MVLVASVLLIAGPVLAAAFPSVVRIPAAKPRSDGAIAPALFSHKTHGGFTCAGCHPAVFPQTAVGFSHDQMKQGRFCGGCHDGELAFAIQGAVCARCHVPTR